MRCRVGIFSAYLSVAIFSAGSLSGAKENQAPEFPNPMKYEHTTPMEYDKAGRLKGATTTVTVSPANDADGDFLTYAWALEPEGAGEITGEGTTVVWRRVIEQGEPKPGTLKVVASDGKGGQATASFTFE